MPAASSSSSPRARARARSRARSRSFFLFLSLLLPLSACSPDPHPDSVPPPTQHSTLTRNRYHSIFSTIRDRADYHLLIYNRTPGSELLVRLQTQSDEFFTRTLHPGESLDSRSLLKRGLIRDISVLEKKLPRSSVEWVLVRG